MDEQNKSIHETNTGDVDWIKCRRQPATTRNTAPTHELSSLGHKPNMMTGYIRPQIEALIRLTIQYKFYVYFMYSNKCFITATAFELNFISYTHAYNTDGNNYKFYELQQRM
jgi:hypothetical protein